MKKLLTLTLIFMTCLSFNCFALEDISAKVQVIQTSPVYDFNSQKMYIDISLKNISTENIELPLRLVMERASEKSALIVNQDGFTDNKISYFLFFQPEKKSIFPGETLGPKRVLFNNVVLGECISTQIQLKCSALTGTVRDICNKEQQELCKGIFDPSSNSYSYTLKVQTSNTQETVARFISALESADVSTALESFDTSARAKYGPVMNELFNQMPSLGNDIRNGTLIYITDVMAKYQISIQDPDGIKVYDIYMYKNSSGEWKIFMM